MIRTWLVAGLLPLLGCLMPSVVPEAPTHLQVDVSRVLSEVSREKLGISLNYMLDNDADWRPNAPRSTEEALLELGVGSLRFPGGEGADAYLWSEPPYTTPQSRLARTGACEWPSNDGRFVDQTDRTSFVIETLDFEMFMGLARRVGAQPSLVVAQDAPYRPSPCGGRVPTRQQLLEAAAAWVRYANVTRGYDVRYWEIGNEAYNEEGWNGSATIDDYVRDVIDFSRGMKAVDGSIRIGANGSLLKEGWWKEIIRKAAPDVDFLVVHEYPCWGWGSYDYYRSHVPNLTREFDAAREAIRTHASPEDQARLRIAVTEFNALDYAEPGWPDVNDLGHALVVFETAGAHLEKPELAYIDFWGSRWVNEDGEPLSVEAWDGLDANNQLTPTGRALAIWGQFIRDEMVWSTDTRRIRSFASAGDGSDELSIFLINKHHAPEVVRAEVLEYDGPRVGSLWELLGAAPEDRAPTWSERGPVEISSGFILIELPPFSITVLHFGSAGSVASPR